MRRQVTGCLLSFSFIVIGASVCYPQSVAAKKGCDYITQSEAETMLGVRVQTMADTPTGCWYDEVEGKDNGPHKILHLTIFSSRSPVPNDVAATLKSMLDSPVPSQVVKDVPGFADAAIWRWVGTGGVLTAFKGGTLRVEVNIAGLPEAVALQKAKEVAARPLGGTGGTGYAYLGAPKGGATPSPAAGAVSDALAAAAAEKAKLAQQATAAAAAEDAAFARLLQQGKTFSQAPYITQSQFLKTVKEVALTFTSDPSLGKYISAAEQRSYLTGELAKYGITVRPGAPITLRAVIRHSVSVYTKTYFQSTGQSVNGIPLHDIEVALNFIVRAAAFRNGKVHLVAASPAYGDMVREISESSDYRKELFGAEDNVEVIRNTFKKAATEALNSIASNTAAEAKPWVVTSWTASQKASADAEFTRATSPQAVVEKRVLDGLDTVPALSLQPNTNSEDCDPDSSWSGLWTKAFQRVGLVDKRGASDFVLRHVYYCTYNGGLSPLHYFWLFDTISVIENNLVFQLNGSLVRRPGELMYAYHSQHVLEKDIEAPTDGYFQRSITDFLVDFAVAR